MTGPDRWWAEIRRLLPDADLVVLPPSPAGTWIGRATRPGDPADHLAVLWPVLTGGLPPPATTVRTGEGLVARHTGPVTDLRGRVDRAADALAAAGWTVRRRTGGAGARLLTAGRGGVTAELRRWPDPPAVEVLVRVGPGRELPGPGP